MTIEPVPDLLAELRAGRYPYDFIDAIAGGDTQDAATARSALRRIWTSGEDGKRFTAVLLFSLQRMLLEVARQPDGQLRQPGPVDQAIKKIVDRVNQGHGLALAANPDAIYRLDDPREVLRE